MDQGIQVLINAIIANDQDKVKELLPKINKADLNSYHSYMMGDTYDFQFMSPAVACVIYAKNSDMVKLLLKHDVNFKLPDPSLKTPTAYEMLKDNSELLQILDSYYAHQDNPDQKLVGDIPSSV